MFSRFRSNSVASSVLVNSHPFNQSFPVKWPNFIYTIPWWKSGRKKEKIEMGSAARAWNGNEESENPKQQWIQQHFHHCIINLHQKARQVYYRYILAEWEIRREANMTKYQFALSCERVCVCVCVLVHWSWEANTRKWTNEGRKMNKKAVNETFPITIPFHSFYFLPYFSPTYFHRALFHQLPLLYRVLWNSLSLFTMCSQWTHCWGSLCTRSFSFCSHFKSYNRSQ